MYENYFGILREDIGGATRRSTAVHVAAAPGVSSVAPFVAPSSAFASPKKRSRIAAPLRPSEAAVLVKTVQELHMQDLNGSDAVKLTAVVLNHPEEPRWGTATDRKTKVQSQLPIVCEMPADSSGPIVLEL